MKEEKVVRVFPLTETLNNTLINAINQMPQPYGGVTMNPTDGIIVHIRYAEPVTLKNNIYPQPITDLYLFLEPNAEPRVLLFFSHGHRPRVYSLQADSKRLIQAVQSEGEQYDR
ncbi:hypothetical protein [Cohnella yongneupensis]|uniref:Uncharacterized protein n=1 Tax=Cohnella yongneupensis TaxID=425006 RepID=A0ABW0QU32_9BACL